jgi:hypothetical protein
MPFDAGQMSVRSGRHRYGRYKLELHTESMASVGRDRNGLGHPGASSLPVEAQSPPPRPEVATSEWEHSHIADYGE